MSKTESNPQLELAYNFVEFTSRNIFLTGKAGTGKTTFLHNLREKSPKRMIVVAPTGVAAINAKGVTIHSFFQLPFGPILPHTTMSNGEGNIQRFSKIKINIIHSLELLVIDEISMVRADVLDGIDKVLRRYKNRNQPFGGVQLLMIGDLQQLAPVIKDDEWAILRAYYDTGFFFSSKALQETQMVSIELKKVYRQSDEKFITMLNKIRDNNIDQTTLETLNSRHIPEFDPDHEDGYITLTTHNAQAQEINRQKLDQIKGKSKSFDATITGDFPEYIYPNDARLTLKIGAQVMFLKNDTSAERLYYNGKIGTLVDIDDDAMYVACDTDEEPVKVNRAIWENTRYTINEETKEIQEDIVGTFLQFPLKLAWAITVHKSQGLTFEKAVIDVEAAFAHGQVYVALSRCKSLEGIVLSTPLHANAIILNHTVKGFNKDMENRQPDKAELERANLDYQLQLLEELFSFKEFHWHLGRISKRISEGGRSIQGDIGKQMLDLGTQIRKDLTEVGDKFNTQLSKLFDAYQQEGQQEHIQERIKKGVIYFHSKIEDLIIPAINNVVVETDNKEVKKSVNEVLNAFTKVVNYRSICLKACTNGFELKRFLREKALAAIESEEVKRKPKKQKESISNLAHPILYKKLKEWREKMAKAKDIKPNNVTSLATLVGISDALPTDATQLRLIPGLGKVTMQNYGVEILEVVNDYIKQEGIDIDNIPQIALAASKSQTETFELYKSGLDIATIAEKRGFSSNTIESHLAFFVGTGELDIKDFIDEEKIATIREYFLEVDDQRLGPAREVLGNEYTYGDLKLVREHMIYTGELERMFDNY